MFSGEQLYFTRAAAQMDLWLADVEGAAIFARTAEPLVPVYGKSCSALFLRPMPRHHCASRAFWNRHPASEPRRRALARHVCAARRLPQVSAQEVVLGGRRRHVHVHRVRHAQALRIRFELGAVGEEIDVLFFEFNRHSIIETFSEKELHFI